MKYGTKFVVVPYVPQIKNPVEQQITSLDEKMSSILHDKSLPVDIKVKLYNKSLSDYTQALDNYNLTTQQSTNIAEQSSRIVDSMVEKIQPQLDIITTNTKKKMYTSKVKSKVLKKPISSISKIPEYISAKIPAENSTKLSAETSIPFETAILSKIPSEDEELFDDTDEDRTDTPNNAKIAAGFSLQDDLFLPKKISDARLKRLKSMQVDQVKVQKLMESEGYAEINNKIKKAKNTTAKTRAIGEVTEAIYKKAKKPIGGSGIKKHWKFKNFF